MAVATLLKPQETVFCLHKKSQGFLFRQNIRQMGFVKRRNGCQSISQWSPLNLALRHQLEFFLN